MIAIDRINDAGLLSELHRAAFDDGWSVQACRDILSMPGTRCWIAVMDEGPAGFLVLRQAADEAEIITTGVVPEAREQGIATFMFRHALKELSGCSRYFLEVSEDNRAAQALYTRLGFRQAGRRKGYYADGSDALVMMR